MLAINLREFRIVQHNNYYYSGSGADPENNKGSFMVRRTMSLWP